MSRVLIVGCGDIGLRVATLHQQRGDEVTGIVRSGQSTGRLASHGVVPILADLDEATFEPPGGRFDIVYHCVPPPAAGDRDTRTEHLLASLPPFPRVVYLSTTSVYGDHGGAWVDESTPPRPNSHRGHRRLDAETQLLRWGDDNGVVVIILRVAGIYGPARLPIDRLQGGSFAVRPQDAAPTNRIHEDDLAEICVAAAQKGNHGDVFNCADGAPSSQAEYLTELARLTGVPPPTLVDRNEAESLLPPSMLEFLRDSKCVRADRLREVLGVTLRYPEFRSGLRACLNLTGPG